MAFRTLLDAGIHAAAGSDFSPGPFAPLMGIQGMVTRTGWDGTTWGANQRITRRRGDRGQHDQRRLCVTRGSDQGIDHGGQAGGLRDAGRRSAHGEARTRSRTSRSSAPSSAGRRFIRRKAARLEASGASRPCSSRHSANGCRRAASRRGTASCCSRTARLPLRARRGHRRAFHRP